MWYGPAPYMPQPPPDPPERPEGATGWPSWPWWYGPVAFLAAQFAGLFAGAIVFAATGGDTDDPLGLILATLVFDAILVGTAIFFARRRGKPSAADFGFRRTRFWPAFGWSTLAFFSFLIFAATYTALVSEPEQTTLDDLGAKESDTALVVSAVLVIVIAPVVEELFFRGFFYRALRSRLGPLVSALIVGGLFGLVHATTGVETVPLLAMFGVVLCLLYERTGSLYPAIGLHAFNNAIAYGFGVDAGWLSAGICLAVLVACVLLPRFTAPPARRALAAPAR